MTPAHPAAYLYEGHNAADTAARRHAAAARAGQLGWPAPVIYLDHESDLTAGRTPALDTLADAIEAGRHDALLIGTRAAFAAATPLIALLVRCSRHGVTVGLQLPPRPPAAPKAQPGTQPPARTPLQVVLEIYAAIRDANTSNLLALTHPHVICRPVVRPGLSTYHGHHGMTRLVTDMHAAHGNYHIDTGTITQQPGPLITVHATTVFTVCNGRVTAIESRVVASRP
jgi:hypothetical protein